MRLAFYDERELSGVGYMRFDDWQRKESELTDARDVMRPNLILIDVMECKTVWEAQRHASYLSNVELTDDFLMNYYGPDHLLECQDCRELARMAGKLCSVHDNPLGIHEDNTWGTGGAIENWHKNG